MTQYMQIPADSTSRIAVIFAKDASGNLHSPKTGLAYNTASLTAYYNRNGASGAATAISLVTATKGTWTSGGFVAVDGTNFPGAYELHIPNAALATGATSVDVCIKGAAGLTQAELHIDLTTIDAAVATIDTLIGTPADTDIATDIANADAKVTTVDTVVDGIAAKVTRIFKRHFNKMTVTATERKFYDDDNNTLLGTQTLSDNGTTWQATKEA